MKTYKNNKNVLPPNCDIKLNSLENGHFCEIVFIHYQRLFVKYYGLETLGNPNCHKFDDIRRNVTNNWRYPDTWCYVLLKTKIGIYQFFSEITCYLWFHYFHHIWIPLRKKLVLGKLKYPSNWFFNLLIFRERLDERTD